MHRRFGLIYTVFSLVVLVALTVLVLARINASRAQSLTDAEASFRRLRTDVAGTVERGEPVRDILSAYALAMPDVRALLVFDPDLGLRYVWSADADLVAVPRAELDVFRGFPRYRSSEIQEVRFRDEIGQSSGGRLYLDAVYRVLSFSDVYPPLRDSLIALLAFALLTVLIILTTGRSSSPETGTSPRGATPPGSERSRKTPDRSDAQSNRGVPPAPEAASSAEPAYDDIGVEEVSVEELATEAGEPGTLFSPVTGLSHRAHLEKRLGLELERSAYNDQDLSCLLIRFTGAGGADAYTEQARQVLAEFQFEDLCFEYDDHSFCVVMPSTELPQALRQANSFRARCPATAIGLSARNGRLVEAHRLLTEADRSLTRAEREPGRIVGFQPDPRKYRQFVTRQRDPSGSA